MSLWNFSLGTIMHELGKKILEAADDVAITPYRPPRDNGTGVTQGVTQQMPANYRPPAPVPSGAFSLTIRYQVSSDSVLKIMGYSIDKADVVADKPVVH